MARPKKTEKSVWEQCQHYESRLAKLQAAVDKLQRETPKAVLNLVKKKNGLAEDDVQPPATPPAAPPPDAKPNGKGQHRAQA